MTFDPIFISKYLERHLGIESQYLCYTTNLREDLKMSEKEIAELLTLLVEKFDPFSSKILKTSRFEYIMDIIFFFALNDIRYEFKFQIHQN